MIEVIRSIIVRMILNWLERKLTKLRKKVDKTKIQIDKKKQKLLDEGEIWEDL